MNRLSELEKAYVACAIDTEGCLIFSLFKNGSSANGKCVKVHISITNNNKEWIDNLQRIIGYGTISIGKTGVGFRKKGCWILTIARRPDVLDLLLQVFDYLVMKRMKAARVITFFDGNPWLYGRAEEVKEYFETARLYDAGLI